MKKYFRTLAAFLSVMMLCGMFVGTSFAAETPITVKVDGETLSLEVAPVLDNNRALVPVRAIAEALGGVVTWDNVEKVATIVTADNTMVLHMNDTNAIVNGKVVKMDVASKIINNRILVPLRFVGDSLGATVDYNGTTRTITVDYFSSLAGTLKIGGSTTVQPVAQQIADVLIKKNAGLSVSVAGGGSGAGVKGAVDGTFNIGCASRELTSAEITTTPDLKAIEVGRDAITVIVNKNNSVTNLTKQQIIDIFTGKITNWKDVGGKDSAIFVYTREPGSGTLSGFEELALAKAKVVATATPNSSNTLVKQSVAASENAIGFISLGILDKTVTGVSIGGVEPTTANAMNSKYPYVRGLFLLTKGTPSGITAKYINYIRSTKGQLIVVAEDYLPLR